MQLYLIIIIYNLPKYYILTLIPHKRDGYFCYKQVAPTGLDRYS